MSSDEVALDVEIQRLEISKALEGARRREQVLGGHVRICELPEHEIGQSAETVALG